MLLPVLKMMVVAVRVCARAHVCVCRCGRVFVRMRTCTEREDGVPCACLPRPPSSPQPAASPSTQHPLPMIDPSHLIIPGRWGLMVRTLAPLALRPPPCYTRARTHTHTRTCTRARACCRRRSIYYLPVIDPYNGFAVLWTAAILLLDMVRLRPWPPPPRPALDPARLHARV